MPKIEVKENFFYKALGKNYPAGSDPLSGPLFGQIGAKRNRGSPAEQEILGLALQIYNIFQRKANRPFFILTFQAQRRPW